MIYHSYTSEFTSVLKRGYKFYRMKSIRMLTNLMEGTSRNLMFSEFMLLQTDLKQCKEGTDAKLTKTEKLPQSLHFHISHIIMIVFTNGNFAMNLVALLVQGKK